MLVLRAIICAFQGLRRFNALLLSSILSELTSDLFKFNCSRIANLTWIYAVVNSIILWNCFGSLVDALIFPSWKAIEVQEPTFIVGNARSGTTWLHRLLAKDNHTFTSMKTWELLFATSITYKIIFYRIYDFDKKYFRSVLYKLVNQLECLYLFGLSEETARETKISQQMLHPIGNYILYMSYLYI